MIDYAPIIIAIVGSGALFSFIQFLISRKDKRNDRVDRIERKIDLALEQGKENELATTRLQLIWLIESHPENEDTILKTAQRYFIELDGDGEAWAVFHKWADENKLDTSWYRMLIKKEERS